MERIYLDYNATTPIHPEVAEAMMPFLSHYFGNPSSSHWFGVQTRKAVEKARAQVAALLKCNSDEVIFTSGGSESNNMAIKGYVLHQRSRGTHLITSQVEHPAVLEVCRYLESVGFEVTYLPVDQYGMISLDDLKAAIRPTTILISIMQANNEVGTIMPIREIADIAHRYDIILHTDSAQAVGKIAVDIETLQADMISIAGHKLYGPKGIGVLYLRRGVELDKFIHGADHEQNRRAGTENVLEIVGLGKACEVVGSELGQTMRQTTRLRDKLQDGLTAKVSSCKVNGHPERRLPNTLSISFPGIEAQTIMSQLDNIACSPGAACHSDKVIMSHVLEAMKVPPETAMGTLRLSLGSMTTEEEIDYAIDRIAEVVNSLSPTAEAIAVSSEEIDDIRLTRFTHGLGCACKLRPQALEKVLANLPPLLDDENVIVGTASADDAAVYKIADDLAVVQTVDFFTPIVDDPYDFGAIAAANSLSDIYAMGATPTFALNVVGFPSNRLPLEVLQQILTGASDKAAEAGINILGGHTVDDTEPKFGLVVTGTVHPDKVVTNNNARVGDKLVLTKPIGLGIITTAMKRQMADPDVATRAIRIMSTLNNISSQIMFKYDISACTDITGFGLLGHLKEMTVGSGVDAVVNYSAVPLIEGALDLARSGNVPGGTENNLDYLKEWLDFAGDLSPIEELLLCDAQTSGGLLIAVNRDHVEEMITEMRNAGVEGASLIGEINQTGSGKITVL